ncbi:hypothetical protein B9Z55_011079 [Caenorhabditis nigoni]|uniref:Cytochrome b5 heme-binding domain-containing protein n=1 Tax=Caenorhabditis nigoni TaxID=1611254 RepID=A0A2G5UIJ9_9PELO|nr:hypothetical protein B9Z55_011079 [Caenorhabditis nigoni]
MQIGEYEPTPIDVTLFVIMLVALKRIVKWLLAPKIEKPAKYEVPALETKDRTMEEVRRLRDEENRCLVVVHDKIYDFSTSQDLYDKNRDVFEAKICGDEWVAICERKFPHVGNVLKQN